MPKGTKIVIWTPENDRKLLLALLAVNNGPVDYAKVADAYGPGVPASCIQTRILKLRKNTRGESKGTASSPRKSATRAPVPVNANKKRKANGKVKHESSDEASMSSDQDNVQEPTPEATDDNKSTPAPSAKRQKTLGGSVTKRISPRKMAKKNYNAIEDPFVGGDETDGEGNRLFEKDKSDSEDSGASDKEYGSEGKAIVKDEAVSETA